MMCTDCSFKCLGWGVMRNHYKIEHPTVIRPDKYFTREARRK